MAEKLKVPDAAVDFLRNSVRYPAFMEKLARDWNIQPRNQAEAGQLVHLAGVLRAATINEQVKTASNGNPYLAETIANLETTLQSEGAWTGPTGHEQLYKEAACNLVAHDANVAKAALDYASYLSELEATAVAGS